MNPKHSSESVLMVVTIAAILICAVTLFVTFGPGNTRNTSGGTSVSTDTVAPYSPTKKEQWIAAALTGDGKATPILYHVDEKYRKIRLGCELYRYGKRTAQSGTALTISLSKENRSGMAAVTLSGNTARYTLSTSAEDITAMTKPLGWNADALPEGWKSTDVVLSAPEKIQRGQRIYLKTFLASKGDQGTVPEAASIHRNPKLVQSYGYCGLFYIQFL